MRKIRLFKPELGKAELQSIKESFSSSWIGLGPKVNKFEHEWSEMLGCKESVAVNSCTAALHLSLMSLDIKKGDEVITTPLTFCSTINTILHVGATPVLVDIDPNTLNIDPRKIENRITTW